jgi:CRP-like cAMP-binding protein
VACEDTTLLVLTADMLNDEMDSMQPWMGAIVRALASRFRAVQDQHLDTIAPDAPQPTDDWELWSRFK